MWANIKIVLGIILIIVSFVYILRRPGVSMMESLLQQREKKMELLKAQQEEEARLATLEAIEGGEEGSGSDEHETKA